MTTDLVGYLVIVLLAACFTLVSTFRSRLLYGLRSTLGVMVCVGGQCIKTCSWTTHPDYGNGIVLLTVGVAVVAITLLTPRSRAKKYIAGVPDVARASRGR